MPIWECAILRIIHSIFTVDGLQDMSLKLGKASDIINFIDNICKLGINFMPLSLRGVLEHPEHPPGYATVSCVSGLYSLVATSI